MRKHETRSNSKSCLFVIIHNKQVKYFGKLNLFTKKSVSVVQFSWPCVWSPCPWTWPQQRSTNTWHTQRTNSNSRLLLPPFNLLLPIISSLSPVYFNVTSPIYSSCPVYNDRHRQNFTIVLRWLRPAIYACPSMASTSSLALTFSGKWLFVVNLGMVYWWLLSNEKYASGHVPATF